ncbi:MAG: helix-turn-helix transcriptional regulator [Clostridia bacterium]|nr:helix-turn-helix transcriptional regulator [Clostridia bacterium]
MNFGETIYTLRMQNNLSQGELADKLEVSRQSVSKWENNMAVPELDKIIRMSEIFGVTVDSLVKGEEYTKQEIVQPQTVVQVVKEPMEKRVIAGILLLALGGVAFILLLALTGLGCFYALPVLLCGAICMLCKKNVGFYCTWLIYIIVSAFLATSTAVSSWNVIFYTFRAPYSDSSVFLLIGWIWFAVMLAMLIWSVAKFYKRTVENKKKTVASLVCTVVYKIADYVAIKAMFAHYIKLLEANDPNTITFDSILVGVNAVSTVIEPIVFTIILVQFSRILYSCLSEKRKV